MTENTATLDSFEIQTEHRSLWVDVWRQFRKHKGALVGMFVFMLITFCVFIGPFIYDVDPNAINFRERNLGPSWSHPLGTDNIGHDTLAQMLAGGRVSLAVGFLAMLISLLIGSLIGVLAGFIKSLDGPLMRLTDLFLALRDAYVSFQGVGPARTVVGIIKDVSRKSGVLLVLVGFPRQEFLHG